MASLTSEPTAVPPPRTTELIAALDAAHALPATASLTLFARDVPEGEYVFRLWASAHSLELQDRTQKLDDDRYMRVVAIKRRDGIYSVAELFFVPAEAVS